MQSHINMVRRTQKESLAKGFKVVLSTVSEHSAAGSVIGLQECIEGARSDEGDDDGPSILRFALGILAEVIWKRAVPGDQATSSACVELCSQLIDTIPDCAALSGFVQEQCRAMFYATDAGSKKLNGKSISVTRLKTGNAVLLGKLYGRNMVY